VLVGREQTGLSLNELGKVFGIRHYRTVGAQCYRLKKAIKERGDLKKIYERLSRECSPVET
jgi:chromosomal replication initiation ATPase DnaA